MNIAKDKLLVAMKKALPGVDKGATLIEGADTFLFAGAFLHSYNDAVSVSVPVELDGLHGACKSLDAFRLISKINAPIIEVEAEGNKWKFSAGRTKAELTLIDSKLGSYLEELKLDAIAFESVPEDFAAGLKLVKMAQNTDPRRGVCVSGNLMVSTDSVRMNRYQMKSEMKPFWIDDPAIADLLKLDEVRMYALSEAWVHFRLDDGTIFSCKRKDHTKYPLKLIDNLINEVERKDNDVGGKLPASLTEVVDRVATLATDVKGSLPVRLALTPAELEVYAEKTTGKASESIPWETPINCPKTEVWVDSSFLLEAGKKVVEFYLTVSPTTNATALVFTTPSYTQVASSTIKE